MHLFKATNMGGETHTDRRNGCTRRSARVRAATHRGQHFDACQQQHLCTGCPSRRDHAGRLLARHGTDGAGQIALGSRLDAEGLFQRLLLRRSGCRTNLPGRILGATTSPPSLQDQPARSCPRCDHDLPSLQGHPAGSCSRCDHDPAVVHSCLYIPVNTPHLGLSDGANVYFHP